MFTRIATLLDIYAYENGGSEEPPHPVCGVDEALGHFLPAPPHEAQPEKANAEEGKVRGFGDA